MAKSTEQDREIADLKNRLATQALIRQATLVPTRENPSIIDPYIYPPG